MLTPDERRLVIEELADHLGPTGDVRQMVTVIFAPNHRELLLILPTNVTAIVDQAQFVVDHCMDSRWRYNPSLMELLLIRLVTIGGKGQLAPIRNRVHAGTDPNPNVYKTLWVLAGQPFIDRKNLRAKLQQFVEMSDRPILRVWGVRGAGKSYTSELLNYVMQKARPDIHVASASLAIGNGPSYDAVELAETLALAFSPDENISERRNSSYAGALMRWIVRNTLKKPGLWIYVLDGFGQSDVKDETRELIQLLAQQVCAPEFSRRLRLMLLDYDAALPGNWRAKTLDDNLLPAAAVQRQDLMDCLTAYNAEMLGQGRPHKVIEPAQLGSLADALLQRSPNAPPDQLRHIYDQLVDLANVGDD